FASHLKMYSEACTVGFLYSHGIITGPMPNSTRNTASLENSKPSSNPCSAPWASPMSKAIEEILAPKPEARPRIYAYSIADKAHQGLLKVGQTTRNVKQRIAEQLRTA